MIQTRKPGKQRRAEIVNTALGLLAEYPAERLSTALIAERIGLTQAALFRHFPSKDALWEAVLSEIEKKAEGRWDRAQSEGAAPLDRLRGILRAQLGLIAETPAIPALIFSTGKMAAERMTRPIHLRVMRGLSKRISREIAAAMESGALRRDIPPADAALLLLGLVQGVVLRWSLSGQGFRLPDEGMRLIDLQLRLLGAKEPGDMP